MWCRLSASRLFSTRRRSLMSRSSRSAFSRTSASNSRLSSSSLILLFASLTASEGPLCSCWRQRQGNAIVNDLLLQGRRFEQLLSIQGYLMEHFHFRRGLRCVHSDGIAVMRWTTQNKLITYVRSYSHHWRSLCDSLDIKKCGSGRLLHALSSRCNSVANCRYKTNT